MDIEHAENVMVATLSTGSVEFTPIVGDLCRMGRKPAVPARMEQHYFRVHGAFTAPKSGDVIVDGSMTCYVRDDEIRIESFGAHVTDADDRYMPFSTREDVNGILVDTMRTIMDRFPDWAARSLYVTLDEEVTRAMEDRGTLERRIARLAEQINSL